jgi:predicted DNA-binding protein (MmcQ/YjbR family)
VNAAGDRLQDTARQAALALPDVSHGYPFTPGLDVYKVAGKVFLIVTDDPAEQIITVKCEPEHARAQERGYASITPGRYLDKRHWISLGPGPGITVRLITDAVEDSYDLEAPDEVLLEQPCSVVGLAGHELTRGVGAGQIDHVKAAGPCLPISPARRASGSHPVGEAVHVRPMLLIQLVIIL